MQKRLDHISWIDIDSKALQANINIFRTILDKKTLLGVVLKSNAYGHGLLEVLKSIHSYVDIIHLINPEDAFKIRKFEKQNNLKMKRIIVIGALSKDHIENLSNQDIEIVLYGNDFDLLFSNHKTGHNKKIKCHLHFDTGLGREGLTLKEISTIKNKLDKLKNHLVVKGVMSHFANTEDVTDQKYAKIQLNNFKQFLEELKKTTKLDKLEKHFAASAATMLLPESRFDAVRIGISLYGMWPSKQAQISYNVISKEIPKFSPVINWKVNAQIIKEIEAGSFIGYGLTYKCETLTKIAVLPVGYFDGYPRMLSNKAHVLVNGQRCPLLGRVMMNHIVVDITNAVKNRETVLATLLGTDQNEKITAEMIADWSSTINYEVVARIPNHLPRFVI